MIRVHFRCDVIRDHFRFSTKYIGTITMVLPMFKHGTANPFSLNLSFLCIIFHLPSLRLQDIAEVTSCSTILSGNKGVLVNVNFPGEYVNGLECNVTIRVQGAVMIEVMFDYFHTESDSDFNLMDEMCTMDYLTLSDFYQSHTICGHWQGRERLLYFRFFSSEVRLTFRSDEDGVRPGYKLRWFSTQGSNWDDIASKACSNPLLETDQSCFEVIPEPETWEVGHNRCRERGGILAQIEDEAVHRDLERSLNDRNMSMASYWIGANDQLFEGDYMWTDMSSVGFRNWFPGWLHATDNDTRSTSQPSDDGFSNEDCVEIRRHFSYPGKGIGLTDSYFWNDRSCLVKNPFICQHVKEFGKRVKRYAPLDCNGLVNLTADNPRAVLTSPGFPGDYPRLLSCHVIVTVPFGYQVKFDFIHLNLEDSFSRNGVTDDLSQSLGEGCEFDNLTLANHPATTAGNPGSHVIFCGDWNEAVKLARWTSSTRAATLSLQTDNSKQFSGFKVVASIVNKGESLCNFSSLPGSWIYGPDGCWQIQNEAQNYTEAETGCQTAAAAMVDVTAVRFVGGWLDTLTTNSSCLDLWTTNVTNATNVNLISENNTITTDDLCTSVRVCRKASSARLVPDYSYTATQVPCSSRLAYVCRRPEINHKSHTTVFNHTANSGYLKGSCNYSNNEDVTHIFQADEGYRILLEINGYDIEYQQSCLYDVLEVTGTTQDRKICGHSMMPLIFISSNATIILRFKSDDDVTGCGFNVTWNWIAVNRTFDIALPTTDSGIISSVNFPKAFPDRLAGCYDVIAAGNQRVILELSSLELPGIGCVDSVLEISNVSNDGVIRFCGGTTMQNLTPFQTLFVSIANEITICFKATSLDMDEGFAANFSFVSKENVTVERSVFVEPGQTVSVSSLQFPHGFPSDFRQTVDLFTTIGHYIAFDRCEVISDNRTNCSADNLAVFDLSVSADYDLPLYSSSCPFDSDGPSTVDVGRSVLNFERIVLQSGYHSNGTSSIQFRATISSLPDPKFLQKTALTSGSFVGCEESTCRNNGRCEDAGNGRSTCACAPQYRGLFCQVSMCDLRPCRHGNCSLTSTGFACTCRAGYWGERCELDDATCRWKMCSSHGRCVLVNATRTACLCDPTWTGARCSETIPVVPETLTIGQKLLKEPIWIGMIVILNLVLFFCLSYIFRRKCGSRLSQYLPRKKKATVSAVSAAKEDTRTETSVSSPYLEIPRMQSTTPKPRLKIHRGFHGEQSPTVSGPATPEIDDGNREAAMKLFESYKSNMSPNTADGLSPADLETKVQLKSHLTDFRMGSYPESRLSFNDRLKPRSVSPPGILRSYTIHTGLQESQNRLQRLQRLNKRRSYAGASFDDIERGARANEGKTSRNETFNEPLATSHCFPEIRILNEDNKDQITESDSEGSVAISANPKDEPQINVSSALKKNPLELRRSIECIDSGYPSTCVSSSNTNPAAPLENTDKSRQGLMSAVDRRKLYSSKAKSSSFYNITTSDQYEKEHGRNFFSFPEKRIPSTMSFSRDVGSFDRNKTDLASRIDPYRSCMPNRFCFCPKSKYERGAVSCESDLDYISRCSEFVDTASFSRGLEYHRRHHGHSRCGCNVHRCNSNRSFIASESLRQSRCKHWHPAVSTSRHFNVGDLHRSCSHNRGVERVSSSESELFQRPRRPPKIKRKQYKNRKSQSYVETKYNPAELYQRRRIERDFESDEPYKAAMLRSFLSDTYLANKKDNFTMDSIEPVVDNGSQGHQIISDDILDFGTMPMQSPSSLVINYGKEFDFDGRNKQGCLDKVDTESVNMQYTDGTDNSVFGDEIKSNGTSTAQSPHYHTKKHALASLKLSAKDSSYQTKQSSMDKSNGTSIAQSPHYHTKKHALASLKLSTKDSAYQTKQSSMDKYAPVVTKQMSHGHESQRASRKSESSTRPEDKVKRHLHQAALKLQMFKRLTAREQISKDSAMFSEEDASIDEMDPRHKPLVKRTSGSLLALQMKELNLSRVTEELSRETNTPVNEPQTDHNDRPSSVSIKSPSDIHLTEDSMSKLSAPDLRKVSDSSSDARFYETDPHLTEGSLSKLSVADLRKVSDSSLGARFYETDLHLTEGSLSKLSAPDLRKVSHSTSDAHFYEMDKGSLSFPDLSDVAMSPSDLSIHMPEIDMDKLSIPDMSGFGKSCSDTQLVKIDMDKTTAPELRNSSNSLYEKSLDEMGIDKVAVSAAGEITKSSPDIRLAEMDIVRLQASAINSLAIEETIV